MPETISREIKNKSLSLAMEGRQEKDIALELNISVSTVQRAKWKAFRYGDVEGGRKKAGPKGKIDGFMEEVESSFVKH